MAFARPTTCESNGKAEQILDAPPRVLREAFAAADRVHDRVLSFAEPRYYYDVAVPVHRALDEEGARFLQAPLCRREAVPGVYGPVRVRYQGRLCAGGFQRIPCG